MKETFRRVKELFLESLQKEDPADRAAFLREACGSDVVLHRQVEALLRKHDHAGSFLEQPAAASEPEGVLAAAAGSRIGPYRLLELIGEGGMGSVWLAQQQEPVKRQVALKIIKPGMDSAEVIARFEAERQALALMDHPHIARVLDAGALESGRPYFVMDLVQGVPITRWCAEQALTTRQRLELFVGVCQAVQHAHQKGIIHRDLKPSNVLVASCDGQAAPRVIDFGVAKALGEPLTERTLFTGLGSIVGTFEYMSPEQAEFNALDVDTRADVYSLGVLLYELLTGTTPLTKQRLQQTPLSEVLRLIREEEPPRPSSRLGTGPSGFQELDWIVLKCLEKDRARRYQSASELARDVERHLRDEPVEAGPPGAGYRLRKFAKRQRKALVTVTGFLLLLLTGTVVSAWNARQALAAKGRAEEAEVDAMTQRDRAVAEKDRADEEAAIAEAVNDFLLEDLLGQSDIGNQVGFPERNPNITVRELLDRAAQRIEGKFRGQELTEAAVRLTLGTAYLALGEYPEAQKHLERSLSLRREKLGADHGRTLVSLHNLALVHKERGRYAEALPMLRRVLEVRRARLGPDHPYTLLVQHNLAMVHQAAGRYDEAEPLFRRVLKHYREQLGPTHPDTLVIQNGLALMAYHRGHYDEAQPMFEQLLKLRQAREGADHPHTLDSMSNLASLYLVRGRFAEAEGLYRQVLERCRDKRGADHPQTLHAMNNLGHLLLERGRFGEAEPLLEKALELRKVRLGAGHPDTLDSMSNLASLYQARGRRFDRTEALLKQAAKGLRASLGADHPRTLVTLNNLGMLYLQLGRHAEAQPLFEQVLKGWQVRLSADHIDRLSVLHNLASVYHARGRHTEAEPLFRQALEGRRRRLGAGHPRTLVTMNNLAQLYRDRRRYPEAQRLLREALRQGRRSLGPGHPYTRGFLANLVRLYDAWGKKDEAARWRKELARGAAKP